MNYMLDEFMPRVFPSFKSRLFFLLCHSTIFDRINYQLFQCPKISIAWHNTNESLVKIITQTRCAPKAGIIVGNHYRKILGKVIHCCMVSQIVDVSQNLIRNWIHFDGDIFFFNHVHEFRVFQECKTAKKKILICLSKILSKTTYP